MKERYTTGLISTCSTSSVAQKPLGGYVTRAHNGETDGGRSNWKSCGTERSSSSSSSRLARYSKQSPTCAGGCPVTVCGDVHGQEKLGGHPVSPLRLLDGSSD
uniref:Uncharacterized protein n=1 Tax=Globodera rostochiensis TaxID=31243 RepID=A0A914I2Q8_GLORO